MIRVAINGFGRIGRRFFRLAHNHPEIEVVAINDLADSKTLSHLLKYDSIHGVFDKNISYTDDGIMVDSNLFPFLNISDIKTIPWNNYNPDVVVEATGKFKLKSDLEHHLKNGAKQVILTVPLLEDDI